MDLRCRRALVWNLRAPVKSLLNWRPGPGGEEAAGVRGGPGSLSLRLGDTRGQMIICDRSQGHREGGGGCPVHGGCERLEQHPPPPGSVFSREALGAGTELHSRFLSVPHAYI